MHTQYEIRTYIRDEKKKRKRMEIKDTRFDWKNNADETCRRLFLIP